MNLFFFYRCCCGCSCCFCCCCSVLRTKRNGTRLKTATLKQLSYSHTWFWKWLRPVPSDFMFVRNLCEWWVWLRFVRCASVRWMEKRCAQKHWRSTFNIHATIILWFNGYSMKAAALGTLESFSEECEFIHLPFKKIERNFLMKDQNDNLFLVNNWNESP